MTRFTLTAKTSLHILQGDITRHPSDAIVNAANALMLGGGGVDGAIHRAAGPRLKEACEAVPKQAGLRCPVGEARITRAFHLPAAWVIHTASATHTPRASLDGPISGMPSGVKENMPLMR